MYVYVDGIDRVVYRYRIQKSENSANSELGKEMEIVVMSGIKFR